MGLFILYSAQIILISLLTLDLFHVFHFSLDYHSMCDRPDKSC